MKNYFLLFFIIALILQSCSGIKQATRPISLLIHDVNVVDVKTGNILFNQDVAVEKDKVVFVGKPLTGQHNAATIIDGAGKYLIPGLWDMHFHLSWQKGNDTLIFPVLVQYGITGIRDMGGDLHLLKEFRDQSSNKSLDQPIIFGAGPMIDGDPPVHKDFSVAVNEKTNLASALDSLRNNGADFFKTYSLIREKQLRDIALWSKAHQISFAGHLSEYIDPEISIKLGQSSIEHLNRLDEIWWSSRNKIDTLARLMKESNVYLCPTLITYQLKTRIFDSTVEKELENKFIPVALMNEWKGLWQSRRDRYANKNVVDSLNKKFASQKELVKYLDSCGVKMLAGSDFAGMPYVYPGSSLHEELLLMTESGISNLSVLQSATINAAVFMKKESMYGSIELGKQANMILLEGNPLDNMKNTTRIVQVILNGKATTVRL